MTTKGTLDRLIQNFTIELKRGPTDWDDIKEHSIKIADGLRYETGQNKFPIDLSPVRNLRKIHSLQLKKYSFDFQGELIPDSQGFIVALNEDHSVVRRRATIAHEIGHTLFFDISKTPPTRIFKENSFSGGYNRKKNKAHSYEELVCWDFARSLLMPEELVHESFSHFEQIPTSKEIWSLAQDFRVSVDLFSKRIKWNLKLWEDIVLFRVIPNNGKIDAKSVNVWGNLGFVSVMGKEGLLRKNKRLIDSIYQVSKETRYLEEKISTRSRLLYVDLYRYSDDPVCILGRIKKSN